MKNRICLTSMIIIGLLLSACGQKTAETGKTTAAAETSAGVTEKQETKKSEEGTEKKQNSDEYSTVKVSDRIADQKQTEEDIQEELQKSKYTLQEPLIIQDPYGVSPLSALICFQTEKAASVQVTVKGKDQESDIVHNYEEKETSHTIPVYGLYAGKENRVILLLDTGESQEFTLTTDALPDNCIKAEVAVNKNKADFEGLTFVTPTTGNSYITAFDVNGDIRFYMPNSFASGYEITRIENGHIVMASGRLADQGLHTTGIMEINALGKIYREYDVAGAYHHCFKYLPNGNILLCSLVTSTGYQNDAVVEVDSKTGKTIRTIDLKDLLPYQENHSLNGNNKKNWFHDNAVEFDPKTNSILVSGRNMDIVISIDYDTGKLNWILGDPEGWGDAWKKYFFTPEGDNFEWFWAQHSCKANPDGSIFIFDNGCYRSKSKETAVQLKDEYSRGVIYDLDSKNMTVRQRWEFGKERGIEFYSMYISEVTWLDKGHYIIHSGGITYDDNGMPVEKMQDGKQRKADIVEIKMADPEASVSTDGDVVYELKLDQNSFRSERMDVYAPDEKFVLGEPGQLLGQLDAAPVTKDEITVSESSSLDQASMKDTVSDFQITNEPDRIVINGKAANATDKTKAYVILKGDNGEENKVYDVAAPSMYLQISKTELSGNYKIWLVIDGKVIDTGEKIRF